MPRFRRSGAARLLTVSVATAVALRLGLGPGCWSPALAATSTSGAASNPASDAPAGSAKPHDFADDHPLEVRGALPLAVASILVLVKTQYFPSTEHAPKPSTKAPRIVAFDSMRFFLIMYIVCGHFISFAAPSMFAFKAITQINVVVGAFFALSGYVAAYTTTEIGEKKVKDKIAGLSTPKFILQRVFGYWPLHMLVLLLFSPIFVYADLKFSGPLITIVHGCMAATMTQAWFPLHAEVWNAPTWFLGALTFATVLQPFFTPVLARQGKRELRGMAIWLTLFGLLPKIAYCYDFNTWGFLEGALGSKSPNLAIFNTLRFSPFFAVIEVMLGFIACRLVMLDGSTNEGPAIKPTASDTALPFLCMIAVILLRGWGILSLSDMLIRPLVFMPLFLLFLMGLHRASIQPTVTDPLARIMASSVLVWLGGLSFPIFVVHGPLGQLFYKKVVAKQLFGGPLHVVCGPWFFYVYLLIVGVFAFFLNRYFMGSKKVADWSASLQARILNYM